MSVIQRGELFHPIIHGIGKKKENSKNTMMKMKEKRKKERRDKKINLFFFFNGLSSCDLICSFSPGQRELSLASINLNQRRCKIPSWFIHVP